MVPSQPPPPPAPPPLASKIPPPPPKAPPTPPHAPPSPPNLPVGDAARKNLMAEIQKPGVKLKSAQERESAEEIKAKGKEEDPIARILARRAVIEDDNDESEPTESFEEVSPPSVDRPSSKISGSPPTSEPTPPKISGGPPPPPKPPGSPTGGPPTPPKPPVGGPPTPPPSPKPPRTPPSGESPLTLEDQLKAQLQKRQPSPDIQKKIGEGKDEGKGVEKKPAIGFNEDMIARKKQQMNETESTESESTNKDWD